MPAVTELQIARTGEKLGTIAAGLYRDEAPLMRFLARYRPLICPFDRLLEVTPEGSRVLDIGCGVGLFLGLLAARGKLGVSTGFDSDRGAIECAKRMAARTGSSEALRFEHRAAEEAWPEGGHNVVTMIDVMHHVDRPAREGVIRQAARRVPLGGLFIYKDMCRRPLWRVGMNRLHDLVMARQLIHEEPVEHVEEWAAAEGLRCTLRERINLLWYGHELRVFIRENESESP